MAPCCEAAPLGIEARHDVDRDVAGRRIVLQPIEQHPAVDVGQPQVERDRVGLDDARELERLRAGVRDDALEAGVARGLEDRHREAEVVLDDEQHAIARLDDLVVVGDRARRLLAARAAAPAARGAYSTAARVRLQVHA